MKFMGEFGERDFFYPVESFYLENGVSLSVFIRVFYNSFNKALMSFCIETYILNVFPIYFLVTFFL